MTRKRPANSPEYAVTTNPSRQNVTTTVGNSTCSATIRRSDRWLLGPILWFDPRREHSSVPTAGIPQPPRAGPVKAGRVFRGHPQGLALIGPSTVASLIGSGLKALATS